MIKKEVKRKIQEIVYSDCELEGWDIIIPTVPGTESSCYIHHTECNPL